MAEGLRRTREEPRVCRNHEREVIQQPERPERRGHPPGQLKGQKENTMNRSILLGLAMVASSVIGATAVNGLHAQNKAPGAYAALDLRAINSPDVFKTLPSKTGDFDGHTA